MECTNKFFYCTKSNLFSESNFFFDCQSGISKKHQARPIQK